MLGMMWSDKASTENVIQAIEKNRMRDLKSFMCQNTLTRKKLDCQSN